MATDLTRLLQKLVPEKDGEAGLTLRTAVVDAVNGDGTLDITLSGVMVPDVPALSGASFLAGDVVQVLSLRGSMLVMGSVSTAPGPGVPPISEVSQVSNTTAIGTSEALHDTLPSKTYQKGMAYEVIIDAAYNMSASTNYPQTMLLRKTNLAGAIVSDFGPRLPAPGFSGLGCALKVSTWFQVDIGADVTAALACTISANAGTVTVVGNSQRPRRVTCFPRGPAAAYTNLPLLS